MGLVSGVADKGAVAEQNGGNNGDGPCCADTNAAVVVQVLGVGTGGITCPWPEEPANMYIVGPA